jgi:hypothetical protein
VQNFLHVFCCAADSKLDVVCARRSTCCLSPHATATAQSQAKRLVMRPEKKTTDNTLTHMQHSCLHGGKIKIKIKICIFIIFIECQDN